MSDYLLLFRGGLQHETGRSPAELQASTQNWMGWIGGIAKSGALKGGQPLDHGGKVIKGVKNVITDGPFAEAKDVVGGYLIVTANDLTGALEIAKGCPAPSEGGSVEVRALAPMPG